MARAASKKPTRSKYDLDPRRVLQDKAVRHRFLLALEKLGSRAAAAFECGFHADTVKREMDRDHRFAANVEMAERGFELAMLRKHAKHETHEYKAVQWRLERKFPDEYGKREPDSVTPEMLAAEINSVLLLILPYIPQEVQREALAVVQRRLESIRKSGEDETDPFEDADADMGRAVRAANERDDALQPASTEAGEADADELGDESGEADDGESGDGS